MTMNSKQRNSERSLHPENPIEIFDHLASSGKPFFAYRLPGEKHLSLGIGRLTDESNYNFEEAFAIAPFDSTQKIRLIIPETSFQTPQSSQNWSIDAIQWSDPKSPPKSYVEGINKAVETLKERGGKIVISRVLEAKGRLNSPASIFHKLCFTYPDSYIYCWSLEDNDLWIGASPELLLKSSGQKLESMALAGTLDTNNHTDWDEKNLEEQHIVTDFIVSEFKNNALVPEIKGPVERKAGPVKHLCTNIFSSILPSFDILGFARQLSPTPAVSGYPRNEALTDIKSFETTSRKYYGGFSGPIFARSKMSFYVTLRCMHIKESDKLIDFYAGGGITARSNAQVEWQETRMKLSTLLSIFE